MFETAANIRAGIFIKKEAKKVKLMLDKTWRMVYYMQVGKS